MKLGAVAGDALVEFHRRTLCVFARMCAAPDWRNITKRIVSKVPGNELRDSRTALAALWIQSVELNRRGSIGYGDSIEGMNLGVGLRGVGVSREYGLRLDRDP